MKDETKANVGDTHSTGQSDEKASARRPVVLRDDELDLVWGGSGASWYDWNHSTGKTR